MGGITRYKSVYQDTAISGEIFYKVQEFFSENNLTNGNVGSESFTTKRIYIKTTTFFLAKNQTFKIFKKLCLDRSHAHA